MQTLLPIGMNGVKRKFRLNVRKNFLRVRLLGHWTMCPMGDGGRKRERWQPHCLSQELHMTLQNFLYSAILPRAHEMG